MARISRQTEKYPVKCERGVGGMEKGKRREENGSG